MSAKRPSPLVGYNTGVRFRGVEYHVQTEDSGVDHPHVVTHLFVEGGHIIATRKSSYAEHVGTAAYPEVVRQLIRKQHKEMIVALRDGAFHDGQHQSRATAPTPVKPAAPVETVAKVTAVTQVMQVAPAPRPAAPSPVADRAPRATTATDVPSKRRLRASYAGLDDGHDSLDAIIIADLLED